MRRLSMMERDAVGVKCVCIFLCVFVSSRWHGYISLHIVRRDGEVWKMREDTAKLGGVILLVLQ